MKVVLLGPPGAGKGTQAIRIADKLCLPKVSSGDLFRNHQEKDTDLGRLAHSYMAKGSLVPDCITIKMVMEWINTQDNSKGFLLDVFPRTLLQAEALDKELNIDGGLNVVLYIKVEEKELIQRLGGRLICKKCQTPFHIHTDPPNQSGICNKCGGALYQRDDDKPSAVKKRLQVYANQTEPLIAHYRKSGKLEEVNGQRLVSMVENEIISILTQSK